MEKAGHLITQVAKFGVIGISSTFIDFTIFAILYYAYDVNLVLANTIGYCLGTVNGFFWNKYWTFSGDRQEKRMQTQFALFFLCYILGLCISNFVIFILSFFFEPMFGKACAVILTFIWNFWSSRRFVYKAINAESHRC